MATPREPAAPRVLHPRLTVAPPDIFLVRLISISIYFYLRRLQHGLHLRLVVSLRLIVAPPDLFLLRSISTSIYLVVPAARPSSGARRGPASN